MPEMIRRTLLLCVFATVGIADAQNTAVSKASPILDLGIMYAAEHSNMVNGGSFWLQGGSAEAAFPLRRSFGVALNVTGADNGNLGVGRSGFSQVAFVAGPRYTVPLHGYRLFGEALFGGVHGFDAVFPSVQVPGRSANAFSMQAGGGMDFDWKKHIAVRAIEASYVRTHLPNGGANVQNELKLSSGIIFRLPVY